MELRHLRYFVTVAETLHFSRAAQQLHIAQPALSSQIKSLENELGVQLLERNRRMVRLTDAGRSLLVNARQVLEAAKKAESLARQAQGGEAGTIRIGYVLTAANERLASVIKAFRLSYPGVEPELAQLGSSAQIAALRERRLDVGFIRPPVNASELASEVIAEENMVIAVAAENPLAQKKRLRWSDLSGQTVLLVHPSIANYYYEGFLNLCRKHKVAITMGPYCHDIYSKLWLASTGLGVAPITESVREIGGMNLAFCSLPIDGPRIQTVMAWHRENRSGILKNFLETVRANK